MLLIRSRFAACLLIPLGALHLSSASAQSPPFIYSTWVRSGSIVVGDPGSHVNPDGWRLATTDTDEGLKLTSPTGFNSLDHFNAKQFYFEESFGGIDIHTLGGNVINREPHNLDSGTWAYAIGIMDPVGTVRAFVQLRLAGSAATTLDTSLAANAVTSGAWSGVNDYIEVNPAFATYDAITWQQTGLPNSPDDYRGFVFPEPGAAVLGAIAFAALATASRRRRPSRMFAHSAA